MSDFIKNIGGWWEFIKGIVYIIVIIGSIPIMIGIVRDLRESDHHHYD